jgi:ribonuclease HI
MDDNEQVISSGGVYLGVTTNNQAEYQAVYQALVKAEQLGLKHIDFRLDSNLVVNQLNGIYKIKNRDLWPIYQNIKKVATGFEKISFSHVGRELNHLADGLVNKILDDQRTLT